MKVEMKPKRRERMRQERLALENAPPAVPQPPPLPPLDGAAAAAAAAAAGALQGDAAALPATPK